MRIGVLAIYKVIFFRSKQDAVRSAVAVLLLSINTPAGETRGNSLTKCTADDAERYSGSSKAQP